MTDRIRTLTVVLDDDYRTDDLEAVARAIKMIKGVSGVEQGERLDVRDLIARRIAKRDLREQIRQLLEEEDE